MTTPSNGGAVEPGAINWRKSSASSSHNSDCIEVASTLDATLVRDSKNRSILALSFPSHSWFHFLDSAKNH
ncbi:MAG TPA: DUF397 domain-containing protein [Actinophytocola sp.]|uniref:DUF397 domain-containing protein n=1 Tax=Actinophytocola sp. TaxID=1872138 RepID=UPI002E020D27|nr:DUF397 domain-containing protein [Actinophytocola sp.]